MNFGVCNQLILLETVRVFDKRKTGLLIDCFVDFNHKQESCICFEN